MQATKLSSVYDHLIDYLVEKATPREILTYVAPEDAEERTEYLLAQNQAGTITPDELMELQDILRLDEIISVLKARAALALNQL